MAGRRPGSRPSAAASPSGPVRVERIGADGDGIAAAPGGTPLYLANTLPGELVQPGPLQRRGDGAAGSAAVLEPSPERVTPPCPHFGPCGGCTLQHWADAPYAAWKSGRAAAAIGLLNVPLARTPPGTRRRVDLAIRRGSSAVEIGLHRRRSHEVVDMSSCPILHPALFDMVQALRPVLLRLDGLRRRAEASVNLLGNGPDLLLRLDATLTARDRINLAAFAEASRVPRISAGLLGRAEHELAVQRDRPTVAFDGHDTAVPPGTFLQASREGEAAIVAAVLRLLPERLAGPIMELYAGSGTLTHALARRGNVLAFEGDPAAAAALRGAGDGRVSVAVRDLARQPLTAAELGRAGVVVLDPPYAGAAAQMPAIAEAGRPVVYVSCNPGALTRDARILAASGFRLAGAAAVDQFLWSSQVETIAAFHR